MQYGLMYAWGRGGGGVRACHCWIFLMPEFMEFFRDFMTLKISAFEGVFWRRAAGKFL